MIDCTWDNPGADPYRGTATAAIMAMASVPPAVRVLLAKKAEVSRYDDLVTISKKEIKGKYTYSPELRSMAFGSKGRVCATVSRNGWAETHTETAMVFCEAGWCVARPAVCNNWALVQRLKSLGPVPPPAPAEGAPLPGGGGTTPQSTPMVPQTFEQLAKPPVVQERWQVPQGPSYEPYYPPVHVYVPLPVHQVPEPPTWLLALAGLLSLGLRKCKP